MEPMMSFAAPDIGPVTPSDFQVYAPRRIAATDNPLLLAVDALLKELDAEPYETSLVKIIKESDMYIPR